MSLLQSLSSGLNKTSKLISRSVPAVFYHPNVSVYYFMLIILTNILRYFKQSILDLLLVYIYTYIYIKFDLNI